MDSATDRPEEGKAAMVWGRLLNVLVAGFFLAQGIYQPNTPIRWIKFLLAGVFISRAYTYRPSRVDKAVSQAMGLGWAVVLLVVMPLLTLAMMFGLEGCNTATMWGIVLAEIAIPGFFVWRYFPARNS